MENEIKAEKNKNKIRFESISRDPSIQRQLLLTQPRLTLPIRYIALHFLKTAKRECVQRKRKTLSFISSENKSKEKKTTSLIIMKNRKGKKLQHR